MTLRDRAADVKAYIDSRFRLKKVQAQVKKESGQGPDVAPHHRVVPGWASPPEPSKVPHEPIKVTRAKPQTYSEYAKEQNMLARQKGEDAHVVSKEVWERHVEKPVRYSGHFLNTETPMERVSRLGKSAGKRAVDTSEKAMRASKGFLGGEVNRFLKNEQVRWGLKKAKDLEEHEKAHKTNYTWKTVYSSQDSVVSGKPRKWTKVDAEPAAGEPDFLKPKKAGKFNEGYRVGKVAKVGDAVVTRLETIGHTAHAGPENMSYLFDKQYRRKRPKSESMKDMKGFIQVNPKAVAMHLYSKRLGHLKEKKDKNQYRIEKTLGAVALGGAAAWAAYKGISRHYRGLRGVLKGL